MAKFGELIKSDLPILLDFYTDWNESSSSMHPVLRDVAAAIGDKGKIVGLAIRPKGGGQMPRCRHFLQPIPEVSP